MEEKNRVRLMIYGSEYIINTEDSDEYIHGIGDKVEKKIRELTDANSRVSLTMAAVFTALSLCDELEKTKDGAGHMRAQLQSYLEDAGRYRMEADDARRQIEKLNKEISTLRMKLAGAGKE